ncbi:MAG: universal stress protein [Gammaproteobacteria bacterium]|nr:universal stress protein [Gammaproteobacteria bacterium]
MIRQMPVQEENIVAFRLSGKLTHDDYRSFLPQLEHLLLQHKRLSVLLELVDFRGWDLAAAWDDFKLGAAHPDDFERIAIVGQGTLQRWMTSMAKPFTTAQIRFFTSDQPAEAWDWLRQPLVEQARDQADPAPYRTILVGVDFSAHTVRAVRRALQIAGGQGGGVHLVHAVDSQFSYDQAYDPVIPMDIDIERSLVEAAEKRMRGLAGQFGDDILSTSVLVGTPREVIVSQAAALHADLIVLCTHGHRGLARLLGSTANGITHAATCDVLTVRVDVGG